MKPKAPESIMSKLDATTKWGKKSHRKFIRKCNEADETLTEVEG